MQILRIFSIRSGLSLIPIGYVSIPNRDWSERKIFLSIEKFPFSYSSANSKSSRHGSINPFNPIDNYTGNNFGPIEDVIDDGSCEYPIAGCTCSDGQDAVVDDCGVCNGNNSCVGCLDPDAENYGGVGITIDDGSCNYLPTNPDSLTNTPLLYNNGAVVEPGDINLEYTTSLTWVYLSDDRFPFEEFRIYVKYENEDYILHTTIQDPNVNTLDITSIPDNIGSIKFKITTFGIDNQSIGQESIGVETDLNIVTNFGCTDSTASNYDGEATADDGSCWYPAPQPYQPITISPISVEVNPERVV